MKKGSFWNAKTRTPSGWIPRMYRQLTEGIAAETEVWKGILEAETPAQIRKAYRSSPYWLNPASHQRIWVKELHTHADEFLTAKKYRYPGSSRASSAPKRILHFARAMVGIMVGIGPARAIDLIRTRKHGRRCKCVQCHMGRWNRLQKPFGIMRS
jgi:hypothetical protein